MEESERTTTLLMKYISVWFWQTYAMMFLISSLIVFTIQDNPQGKVILVSLFLLFIITEIITVRRLREVIRENE